MSTAEQIAKLRQFVAELNHGNLDSIMTHIADDFYNYAPQPYEPTAAEVYYEVASGIKAAFPDLLIEICDLAPGGENGDELKANLTLGGTFSEALWGVPGSGDRVTWDVAASIRIKNGKFAINFDDLMPLDMVRILRECQLVPPPEDMDKPPLHPVAIPEIIVQLVFTGQVALKPCDHLDNIHVTEPSVHVCEECVKSGDIWPALRMCLICGYVGCCDTAKNKHMKKHYEKTGHAIFRSINMDEGWIWCYADNAFFPKRVLNTYRSRGE